MLKKLRIVGGIVAIAALGASLVGCSSNSSSTGGDSGGSAEGTITIGGIWPLSGVNAPYGEFFRDGAMMAIDEINEAGGVDGRMIEMELVDSQAQPEPAVLGLQKIAGQDVQYVLTSFSSQTLAMLPIANQKEIVLVNQGAQAVTLGLENDFLYNQVPLVDQEFAILAEELYDQGFKTAAVIHSNDDGGKGAAAAFEESFKGKISGIESVEFQSTDFRSQLTKLKSDDVEVLVIGAYGEETVNIMNQAREIGWDVQMANTSWANIPIVTDEPAAKGMILTTILFEPDAAWAEKFEKEYGYAPTLFVGNGYDAVQQLKQSLERNGGDYTGAAIKAQLDSGEKFDSIWSPPFSYDELGNISRPIETKVVE